MPLHDQLSQILRDADHRLLSAEARVIELTAETKLLVDEVTTYEMLVADLRAQIEELTQVDEPVPEPAKTVFGACPFKGVSGANPSITDMMKVVTKFGSGIALRVFVGQSDTLTKVARPSKTDVDVMHVSFKPSTVMAITDAAVENAVSNLLPGDVVEVWHESDKKVRDGAYTMPECLARKNRFYDAVKAVRPDLLVANTLTGWEAEPSNPATRGNIDKWADVKADLLGLDLDGINTYPYPNYDAEVQTAVSFVERFGGTYSGWSVPEFTVGRSSTQDPDGAKRVAWAKDIVTKIEAAGGKYVCWFDFNFTPLVALELPAEIDAWKALVAK